MGKTVTAHEHGVSYLSDENVIKLIVVMAAQLSAHIFLSSGFMLACKRKKKKIFPFI